ncbi:hypothetical protein DKY64_04775 [Stenotrophomonas maltophilia]|nr:hypothetical protein DKY64_04775 [Stenotrophomonas maltophilia]
MAYQLLIELSTDAHRVPVMAASVYIDSEDPHVLVEQREAQLVVCARDRRGLEVPLYEERSRLDTSLKR